MVVRQNVDGLMDFARMAVEVGADGVIVQPMDDLGDPSLAELVPTEAQAADVLKQLPEMKEFLEERGMRHNLDRFRIIFNRRLDTRALYRIIPCYMGWIALRVQVGGEVYPCHHCYEALGSAYETPMPVIWNRPAYQRFRRSAMLINKRGSPVEGCSCDSCCHSTTNLRVFERLHPISGWLRTLRQLYPDAAAGSGDATE